MNLCFIMNEGWANLKAIMGLELELVLGVRFKIFATLTG
jgi:hypothetical protein